MKYYILAGETSGDIHGAELVNALRAENPNCKIYAMGGPAMAEAGAEIRFDYRALAIMGFIEVIRNLRKIRKRLLSVKNDIYEVQPDKIIFIDYPGFNLNLAKRLSNKFSLHYYIAPKAWAWKSGRANTLAKHCESVFSILPFEEDFFKPYGVSIEYVGNPSKSQVDNYLKKNPRKVEDYIALFPGSRKQEVERILPIMLEAIRKLPNIQYKISQAPDLPFSIYAPFLQDEEQLIQENYKLLSHAKVALVTSGTATLETALFGVPQVVCYIGSPISIWLAKRLVKLKHISLVNLILDRTSVKELIQDDCSSDNILTSLREILDDEETNKRIMQDYDDLQEVLGNKNAAKQVAALLS